LVAQEVGKRAAYGAASDEVIDGNLRLVNFRTVIAGAERLEFSNGNRTKFAG
jgi:hypothetical protein